MDVYNFHDDRGGCFAPLRRSGAPGERVLWLLI
jgi:hypothetical protein